MDRYTITIKARVNMPDGKAQSIKEDVAMCLERYGEDVRIISVDMQGPKPPEQMGMWGNSSG